MATLNDGSRSTHYSNAPSFQLARHASRFDDLSPASGSSGNCADAELSDAKPCYKSLRRVKRIDYSRAGTRGYSLPLFVISFFDIRISYFLLMLFNFYPFVKASLVLTCTQGLVSPEEDEVLVRLMLPEKK